MIDREFSEAVVADRKTAMTCHGGFAPQMRFLISSKTHAPAEWLTSVTDFGKDPKSYLKVYPTVLLACEKEQVVLLTFLYPRYHPTDDVILTWVVLIRRGYLPELLNTNDKMNVERFMLVNAGVSAVIDGAKK